MPRTEPLGPWCRGWAIKDSRARGWVGPRRNQESRKSQEKLGLACFTQFNGMESNRVESNPKHNNRLQPLGSSFNVPYRRSNVPPSRRDAPATTPHLPTRERTSSKVGNCPASMPLGRGGRDDGAGKADRAGSPRCSRFSKSLKLQALDGSSPCPAAPVSWEADQDRTSTASRSPLCRCCCCLEARKSRTRSWDLRRE